MSLVLEGLSIKLYNKMRKQTLVIAGIITALVGLGGFIYSASAALGGWGGMMSSEWRENLKNSYQNNNYNSWKNLKNETGNWRGSCWR